GDGTAGGGGRRGGAGGGGRRGGRQQKSDAAGSSAIPDLLLPVVQRYVALSGHCVRLLRLEGLLLVGAHLGPLAAANHVCEEEEAAELPASLGSLVRCCLRCSEELGPFLQPAKRAYVFGALGAATARGAMWLLPAIHDINSLGVERMIRALSLLQPPLTALANMAPPPHTAAAAAAASAATSRQQPQQQTSAVDSTAATVAAAAAAAALCSLPCVSGYPSPSTALLAALLTCPELRGERGGLYDSARSYYGLLLVAPEEVVRAAGERPGRFRYAEWMALMQANVPHRPVTDVSLAALTRCLDRAHGLTPGAKVAGVVGAVVGAVQAPA
ncbi:hypothetical protein Agub_g8086, partial [Astrephomene gubernaculifera]